MISRKTGRVSYSRLATAVAIACAAGSSTSAFAQEGALEEITVTGSFISRPADRPQPVSVMDAEEIRANQRVTLAEVVLYREIPLSKLPKVMVESMVMVGGILLILGVALAFTNYLVDAEIPQALFEFMQTHVESALGFLLLLNLMLLVLGAMLDIFSALVIVVPLIA